MSDESEKRFTMKFLEFTCMFDGDPGEIDDERYVREMRTWRYSAITEVSANEDATLEIVSADMTWRCQCHSENEAREYAHMVSRRMEG